MQFTSKQRAYLRSLAQNIDPLFQIGKSAVSPEITAAVSEAFNTHELIKLTVLKNCPEDVKTAGIMISERTRSDLVEVIGRKIVLYKQFHEDPVIKLPRK
ncbi:YhbY family RNA-binding protein [Butyrivibrio sp. MC2013]|uniref:YhbY family RNA-binding protein n=1 Tax=Butyrivibrio sp. MC2013 TaxID=1280686 RepID=UPI00040F57B5|nr:YhbY family RNA-binding protein [Butyrivibrio sp. MC2013]